ncbi:MAG: RidA family protein [Sphingomonas sp.]
MIEQGAEDRLAMLGLTLPEPLLLPDGMVLPFAWVLHRGDRVYVSGHGPQEADGSPAGPFGRVGGGGVSLEDARLSARKAGLSILASLHRELGSLDRISGWCRVHGMINCSPLFSDTTAVLNGFSDLINDVFGPQIGRHARTAVGVAGLPLNFPIEIEAEVLVSD